MLDPLRLLIAVNLILMGGCGLAIGLAICYRAEARYWRHVAARWRHSANAMRRHAVAYRRGV